ncbi:MAG: transglycosylase SLT domain-containing protein [Chloroflexota bacterium]|nr:MAG: transglycosylase SLT domain-containing protein [Chloroflexota bacterium]
MRKLRTVLLMTLLFAVLLAGTDSRDAGLTVVEGGMSQTGVSGPRTALSPVWGSTIRQWSAQIEKEAQASGLDPDFIAAVINAESNGKEDVVSRMGAVGLMGVMPTGPGLEWRPSPETLKDPEINLSWGVAILSEIVKQSGGDVSAALAAYSGGWDQVDSRVPQEYAAQVLDYYARAIAVRSNVSPDIATQWTVATEIDRGHIPLERLILNEQPLSGLRTYGEHIIFQFSDGDGRAYYVKGFAVPLAVVVPLDTTQAMSGSDTVATQLMARLGLAEAKISESNPDVIKACLPSLSRLRGRLATRWFAPSDCPSWHR